MKRDNREKIIVTQCSNQILLSASFPPCRFHENQLGETGRAEPT